MSPLCAVFVSRPDVVAIENRFVLHGFAGTSSTNLPSSDKVAVDGLVVLRPNRTPRNPSTSGSTTRYSRIDCFNFPLGGSRSIERLRYSPCQQPFFSRLVTCLCTVARNSAHAFLDLFKRREYCFSAEARNKVIELALTPSDRHGAA